jgi:hypothetical protein
MSFPEKSPALKKENSQRAVDLFQQVGSYELHHLSLLAYAHTKSQICDRTSCSETRRQLLKLCESCNKLPTSLFVIGVRRLEPEAIFGGGFADIYRASLQDDVVALKRLRIFLNDQDRRALHRVFCPHSGLKSGPYACVNIFSGSVGRP